MNNEPKTITQIRKLTINKDDIIFIKMPKQSSVLEIKHLADCLIPIAEEKKCHFLVDNDIQSVSKISEKEMKKYGWVKKK